MRWMLLLLIGLLACSDHRAAPEVDAAPRIDAAPDGPPARETCACCAQLALDADQVFDLASDGSRVFVVTGSYADARRTLVALPITGGVPTPVATADQLTLATFGDAVFYAAATGTAYEIHQRVAESDTVLGSVSSLTQVQIAANATDVYALGSEVSATATLWRLSRTGAGDPPAVIATMDGSPWILGLGQSFAAVSTSTSAARVELPGPATPTALDPFHGEFVVLGDTIYTLENHLLTSRATRSTIFELPARTEVTSNIYFYGGISTLRTDGSQLFWRVTSGHEGSPPPPPTSWIVGVAASCAWPSPFIALDATHVYGAENIGPGVWVIDVLAR